MKVRLLVIEDDANTASFLGSVLADEAGFDVETAGTAAEARRLAKGGGFDLLLVDRNLPDGDGLDLCSELRRKPGMKEVPVLFLTAKASVEEKVKGLRGGGDDYMTKPFQAAELLARVEALLRRAGRAGTPESIEAGGLRLELDARRVTAKGKPVELWAKEFDLLALLMSQAGRVLSRDFLLQRVWDYGPDAQPSSKKVVDVTISHLREKLGAAGERIATVRGFGYRFDG